MALVTFKNMIKCLKKKKKSKKKPSSTKYSMYSYLLHSFLILKTGDNLEYQALQEIVFTYKEAFSPASTPLSEAVLQVTSIAWLHLKNKVPLYFVTVIHII